MAQLLVTLHSAPRTSLQLKIDILKALLICLRDSHRTRTVFRKVNGFVYVTSVLVALEGTLVRRDILPEYLSLLHTVFHTISTATRFEPANAKFFYHDICLTSLCDTLRLLGCFATNKIDTLLDNDTDLPNMKVQDLFHNIFVGNTLYPA